MCCWKRLSKLRCTGEYVKQSNNEQAHTFTSCKYNYDGKIQLEEKIVEVVVKVNIEIFL